jgi:hypothetical protein
MLRGVSVLGFAMTRGNCDEHGVHRRHSALMNLEDAVCAVRLSGDIRALATS